VLPIIIAFADEQLLLLLLLLPAWWKQEKLYLVKLSERELMVVRE
jgi:hypothetical protein